MAAHKVDVTSTEMYGDYAVIDGLRGECLVTGATAEVFGTGDGSVKRLLATLREQCDGWHVA